MRLQLFWIELGELNHIPNKWLKISATNVIFFGERTIALIDFDGRFGSWVCKNVQGV